MATHYNPNYTDVSQVTGPSGWYGIKTPAGIAVTYIDQEYDGGGWALVMANRTNTDAMKDTTYSEAINQCHLRTGTTSVRSSFRGASGLSNYNYMMGLKFWQYFGGRETANKITVVQYVSSSTVALGSTGSHTKRYRWQFDGFNGTYAHTGAAAVSDETGTGAPGYYSYHAANGYSLTAYDNDQDVNSGNCATYYGNSPFWFGSCWSGNIWGSTASHQDACFWDGSGSDYHNYGAVYIR